MIKSVWHSPQNRKTAQAPPPRQGLLHGGAQRMHDALILKTVILFLIPLYYEVGCNRNSGYRSGV